MKRIIALAVALILTIPLAVAGIAEGRAELGKPFLDFTVTTLEGDTFTLSEALKDHEAVYINLFATWCPPCRREFPDLEGIYARYADSVATIAISVEPQDTPDKLRQFREELGLTLPMAPMGDVDLAAYVEELAAYSIPDSIVIDRFGNLVFFQMGMLPDAEHFERIYRMTLGEGYTESRVWTDFPAPEVNVPYPDDGELSDALNAEGSDLRFASVREEGVFPFEVLREDGRAAAYASNTGITGTTARFEAAFTAREEGALAWDTLYLGDAGLCALKVLLDGETVKTVMGGAPDWLEWAVPVTAGEHRLSVECANVQSTGAIRVGVDDVRLLYGDAARTALEALPDYPVSDVSGIGGIEEARSMDVTANGEALGMPIYLVPGETARVGLDADGTVDPHGALVYVEGPEGQSARVLAELYDEAEGLYIARLSVAGDDGAGDHLYGVYYQPVLDGAEDEVYLINDEEYIDEVIDQYKAQYPGYDWGWIYVERRDEA